MPPAPAARIEESNWLVYEMPHDEFAARLGLPAGTNVLIVSTIGRSIKITCSGA